MAAEKDKLQLEVATPSGLKLRTEAEGINAPSVQGEFGVLPGHLPLLAALKCGLLRYQQEGKWLVAAVGPGFVEAEPDRVRLLTDLFALPKDIDEGAVKKELVEAEDALRKFGERHEGPDYAELQRNVEWAHARLECLVVASS